MMTVLVEKCEGFVLKGIKWLWEMPQAGKILSLDV